MGNLGSRGSIPTSQILAIHEPWMDVVRYLEEEWDSPLNDWLHNPEEIVKFRKDHCENEALALEYLQRTRPSGKTASITSAFPSFEEFLAAYGDDVLNLSENYDYYAEDAEEDIPGFATMSADEQYAAIRDKVSVKVEERYEELVYFYQTMTFPATLYRVVDLPAIESLRENNIGESWTWDESSAEEFLPGNDGRYMLQASVPYTSIDWHETLKLNMDTSLGDIENEVRVKFDAPLELVATRKKGTSTWTANGKTVTAAGFDSWFKGSKVVNADGTPKVVYHGTGADISEFSYEFAGQGNDQLGSGFYFTNSKDTASGYATSRNQSDAPKPGGEQGNVMPVYLAIKKPVYFANEKASAPDLTTAQVRRIIMASPELDDALTNFGDVDSEGKNNVVNVAVDIYSNADLLYQLFTLANDFYRNSIKEFNEAVLAATGYDGVIVDVGSETHYIAWFPSQIKSAIGNNGNYDPNNRSVTASSDMLTVYHVSQDENFELDPNHKPKSGGVGEFYVTLQPDTWKETFGRSHVHAFKMPKDAIAYSPKDYPSMKELTEWAMAQGYMSMQEVRKPSGELVTEADNVTPMVRPELTEKAKELPFYGQKDPMRGGGLRFLEVAYLKAHGFSAVESYYSPDGHEIAVFDTSCLTPIKTAAKTAAPKAIYYHGTSIKNLQSIMSQGLIPEVKQKMWEEDDDAGVHTPSRVSYGGIYITQNLLTAMGAPRDHAEEGREVVIVVDVQPNTFYMDEDDIVGCLNSPIGHLTDNSYHVGVALVAAKFPQANEGWNEAIVNYKKTYLEGCMSRFKHKLKEREKDMNPQLEARLTSLVEATWLPAIERVAAHHFKSGSDYEFSRCWYAVWGNKPEGEKAPAKAEVVPTVAAAEAEYRKHVEQITRTLRQAAAPAENGWNNTARITTPIGFKGSNRILAIAEIRDGRQYRAVNEKGQYTKPSEIIVHYGTLPEDFLNQYRQRIGDKFEVKKTGAAKVQFTEIPITAEESSYEGTHLPGVRIEAGIEGENVGTIEIMLGDETKRGREYKVAYVRGILVAKHYQGQGIGQKLYDRAIQVAKARGCRRFYSDTASCMSKDAYKAWARLRTRYKIYFDDKMSRHVIDLNTTKTAGRKPLTQIPHELAPLAAEAKKCDTFEEFKSDFHRHIKHGQYWHVTQDPNFFIDPNKGPRDMSSMADNQMTKGALMVTSHLEHWDGYYNYDRDDNRKNTREYAALIDLSQMPREDYGQVSRGFGNEFWIEDPSHAKVVKVMPIAAALANAQHYDDVLMDYVNSNADLRKFWELATGLKAKTSAWEDHIPRDVMEHYSYGYCTRLAMVLNRKFGWPIMVGYEGTPGDKYIKHAWVQLPDGRDLDICGFEGPADFEPFLDVERINDWEELGEITGAKPADIAEAEAVMNKYVIPTYLKDV